MWTTPRCLEPEWLDTLPPDDPRALRSRRDLQRVNAWMLNAGIMTRALLNCSQGRPPRRLLDLGSGDGTFMLRVARRLAPHWPGVTAILLDQQSIVSAETRRQFHSLGWTIETAAADVFDLLERDSRTDVDVICANLFLHHFERERLARLLELAAQRTRCFVACEPRRAAHALAASKLLWAIGCNDVSRHDAVVSVRAGFTGGELSALWPAHAGWTLHEHPARLFTHCFAACRPGEASP